ncbi:MAG: hypothetical protein IJT54_03990 [Candidatus Methanomethylophilaceae archaeon]|nr:hypothetical protein [Candidatus Methanomethylophilaceae archaeon]
MLIPSCSRINELSHGHGMRVLEYAGGYIVQMTGHPDIPFLNKDDWNLFMAILKVADARINGVEE